MAADSYSLNPRRSVRFLKHAYFLNPLSHSTVVLSARERQESSKHAVQQVLLSPINKTLPDKDLHTKLKTNRSAYAEIILITSLCHSRNSSRLYERGIHQVIRIGANTSAPVDLASDASAWTIWREQFGFDCRVLSEQIKDYLCTAFCTAGLGKQVLRRCR